MSQLRSHVQRHVVGYIALFVALGGTAAAFTLPEDSVRSRHIVNGQVRRVDLGANAVNSAKVANATLRAADFARLPAARVGNSAGQTVPTDDSTYRLPFDTEQLDNAKLHRVSQPTRLIAPRAGLYAISATVVWSDSRPGAQLHDLTLRVNGTTQIAISDDDDSATCCPGQTLSTIYKLNKGDFVELWIYTDGGLPAPEIQSLPPLSPAFSMAWIGPG